MSESFTLQLSLTIRPCVAEDLPGLEWFGMFTRHRDIIADAFRRHCAGDNPMLVVDLAGFPVAQAWIDVARRAPEGVAVLWAVRVMPLLQGRGIGARLLAAAEAEIRRRGLSVAEIGVEKDNAGARRLYERLGYRLSGEAREEFGYRTPWGEEVREVADQWILRTRLAAEPEG